MLAAPAASVAQDNSAVCDRPCLTGLADAYLDALARRDPSGLPLAPGFRYTENGQDLALNDGMWATTTGLGDYRLHFADPVTGQSGVFAEVAENGIISILSLRLKIEGRRIGEIEAIVAREGGRPEDRRFERLRQRPGFNEIVPHDQRLPREELVRIADTYFEGIEQATGALTPFHPECERVENGTQTTNNTTQRYAGTLHSAGCQAQFDSGFSTFVTEVRERRYPIVDEELGLVFSIMFWDHQGQITEVTLADGSVMRVPPTFLRPFTLMMGELFEIEDGQIRLIEAAHLEVPYKMPSGWQEAEQ